MKVLIYGLGRSGLAAARLCERQGHQLEYSERRLTGSDVDAVEELGAVRRTEMAQVEASVCIAAPGVPIDHPDLVALRARGIETIGEVEWVQRTIPGTMVGITGTAGKGTVTRWVANTLALAGIDAVAGGNIDPALAEVARANATHVVELSSFQLERCPTLRPRIAVILNLGSDHLDRHRSVEAYHAAKRNLLANLGESELFIYNADDPLVNRWAHQSSARIAGFSLQREADACLDGDGVLRLGGEALLAADELRVRGKHHLANALAVALACRELGVSFDGIRAGLRDFEGLPGRYGDAGRIDNVQFIDDSIATRELAVRAALEATPAPVVWIAGGQSKGARVEGLEELIREKVRLFVGIGESGPALVDALKEWVPTILCKEADGEAALRCAVKSGLNHLRVHSPVGGTVLLAPLAASFDQFRDYRDRGEKFRAIVQAEEARWTLSS